VKVKDKKEGWVDFKRIYFTEGFIDLFNGDCASDPNLDEPPRFGLNAFATYLRLNGEGEWKKESNAVGTEVDSAMMTKYHNEVTATEFWEMLDFKNQDGGD
jgi:hypothetical protein